MSSCQHNIIAKYEHLVNKHGISHRSLDWGSYESQQLRFHVLSEIGTLDKKSVLDVGCGLCDFYDFLQKGKKQLDYYGLDITPKMIDAAKCRFPNIDVWLEDIVQTPSSQLYDYVVASGIFYLLPSWEHAWDIIRAMFARARYGIGFNSLSSWAIEQDPGELYLDPNKTISYCRSLTNKIILRHDYLEHDFTLFLYKETM